MEGKLKLLNRDTNVFVKGIIIYVITIALYIVLTNTGLYMYTSTLQIITALVLFLEICLIVFVRYYKKVKGEEFYTFLCRIIVLTGITMRIAVTLYSDCRFYAYDIAESIFDSNTKTFVVDFKANGHGEYILNLLEGHLPETNAYQFYQQPLFYILGALTSKIVNIFLIAEPIVDNYFLVDPAKIVSCMAGCMSIYVVKSFLEKFNLTKKSYFLSLSFFSLHPGLIFISSKVAVDALVMFFMSLTLLFTLNFYENPNWKNTIILALSYGLAVMTKISGALFAPLTIIVFALTLAKKKLHLSDFIKRMIVFLIISLPLGLWYNVRNYMKFGQKFGYIYPQTEAMPTYAGDHTLIERFLINKEWYSDFIIDLTNNCNFHSFFFKTSLYGCIVFNEIKETMIGMFVLVFGVLIAIYSLIAILKYLFKKDLPYVKLCTLIVVGCYIVAGLFYFKEPYTCSMDFRYMAIIVMPLTAVIGRFYDSLSTKKITDWIEILFSLFLTSSVLFYLFLQF